ncbi:MAG: hypothetical protein ACRDCE_19910 [Cetobacterium sp.]|uniref:hypothetical protein n=1 Tax=Cetobacterium sp. TaxID=2071632 RepID=UPI003EE6F7F9
MKHLDMFRKGKLGDLLVGSYFRHLGVPYKILSRDGDKVKCLDCRTMRPVPHSMPASLEVMY